MSSLDTIATLALVLAELVSADDVTFAQRAVVLSTYVPEEHALGALFRDAGKLGLWKADNREDGFDEAFAAAEKRYQAEPIGPTLKPAHAAHVFAVRALELASVR